MLTLLKNGISFLVDDFIFPSICLLCKEKTRGLVVCTCCIERIEIADTYSKDVCYTCEDRGSIGLLCKESLHYRQVRELIASLLTIQLCRQSWPAPTLFIPITTKNIKIQAVAKAMTRFLPCQVDEAVKIRPFTLSDDGLLLKESISLCKERIFSTQDICALSFYPIEEILRKEMTSLLLSVGAQSVNFLSFLSGKGALIE
jgi:hypothetical protein